MRNKEHGQVSPEISVIIPTYNRERFIRPLVQCIKSQTFDNYECIIVDDGSTDHTGELCDFLTAGDPRFVVKHTFNYGVSHARNIALDFARGNYITFVDSDDSIPEDYLEKLLCQCKEKCVDMVIGSFCRVYADGQTEKIDYPFDERVYELADLLPNFAEKQKQYGVYGVCVAKLFLRGTLSDIRFDESIRLAEDFDFYLKLYPRISTVCFDNSCEYGYYADTENSSVQVSDDDIDYLAQLRISIRYKEFLENVGVFYGENKRIVTEQIQKYIFFALFHSRLNNLQDVFREVCEQFKSSQINPERKTGLMGAVLRCVYTGNEKRAIIFLTGYRIARKLLRGH